MPDGVTIRWEGTKELARYLSDLGRDAPREAGRALNEEAELVMTDAKKRTPVDTGRLRSTGHVQEPRLRRSMVEVILGFGTDYALFVHEILENRHEVGEAKFLERAMSAAAPGLGRRLAARLRHAIERRRRAT